MALAAVVALVLAVLAGAEAAEVPAKVAFPHPLNAQVFHTMLADMKETSKLSSKTLRRQMGAQVNNDNYKNTCVIRISHAWNVAAKKHPAIWGGIPSRADSQFKRDQTLARNGGAADRDSTRGGIYSVKDKEGQRVALRVKEMHDWFAEVWGPPTMTDKEQIKRDAAAGGVILFLNCNWGGSTATGHLDLFFNGRCSNKCYFDSCRTVKLYSAVGEVPCSVAAATGRVQGTCRDQELCVLSAADKTFSNWPVLEKGQCENLGSRVKCCVKGGFKQRR